MTQREKFKDKWRTLLNQKLFPKEYLWDPSHQTLKSAKLPHQSSWCNRLQPTIWQKSEPDFPAVFQNQVINSLDLLRALIVILLVMTTQNGPSMNE